MSRRRREMYSGHGRLSVSVCVCLPDYPSPHAYTTARTRMSLGGIVRVPLVVHYWAHFTAISAWISLLLQHSEREMSASACTRIMRDSNHA